jgi:hypothetical protein
MPAPARRAPVRAALRRLGGRILPDAAVAETETGLLWWGAGKAEPPAAARLAARLAELLPEVARPVSRFALPDDAGALAALAVAEAAWPSPPLGEPAAEALLAMRRALASLPPGAWIRRAPVVALRPTAKALIVARRLVPDAAVVARALAGGVSAAGAADEATLRLLDPLLLAEAGRMLAGEGAGSEARLFLPLAPAAALGGGYDRLEAAAGRVGIARLVPWIGLAEAVAAPGQFAAARARFAADGQRLLLACTGAEALGLLATLAAPSDLLGIPAAAAMAAGQGAGGLAALGPQRILLSGCRSEADIAFGLGQGVGLFEGPVVETLLAARGIAAVV